MKTRLNLAVRLASAGLWLSLAFSPSAALAHCDMMDGPVVQAAQRALRQTNVHHALVWVQPPDAPEIERAFRHTLAVRTLSPEARELADRYFFETLVRLHRAGEGAPYTGLRPAGAEVDPAVAAADRALASGNLAPPAGQTGTTLARRAPGSLPAGAGTEALPT